LVERKLPTPRQGEIFWVNLATDPKAEPRPVIVISVDVRNQNAADVLVIPVTKTQRLLPTHLSLKAGEGGLRYDSIAKCEKIMLLSKEDLIESLGAPLPKHIVKELTVCVLMAMTNRAKVSVEGDTTKVVF